MTHDLAVLKTSAASVTAPVSAGGAPGAAAPDTEPDVCAALLGEFARFGFRRTSMVGLAEAAGVSRQTLYNRFGSKDAVLSWAVEGLSERLRSAALHCLHHTEGSPAAVLQEVFWRWLGPLAVMLHQHRYAEEIFGLGKAALSRNQRDPLEGISQEVAAFLLAHKLRPDSSTASDTAFLLAMSAKGLMQICGSETAFREGMARVLTGAGIG